MSFLPLEAALAALRHGGAAYGDARLVDEERETIQVRFDEVETLQRGRSRGIGVRALLGGAWGFGARPGTSEEAAALAARDALEVARAGAAHCRVPAALTEAEPARGTWANAVAEDPFAVPLDRKIADLIAATTALRGSAAESSHLESAEASMIWHRRRTLLATSEGTRTDQMKTLGGAGIKAIVSDDDDVAIRTWPMEFDGGLLGCGYEAIARLDLLGQAPRVRDEALALLSAPPCPAGRATLVLDTPQLALQIHESCGHPAEADRAIGEEISLAGASFLTPDRLGRFRYGASRVNLTADATLPEGLGSFGWDDEGVAARRTSLVSRGLFVGYLSSREAAARLGLGRSAGCMRAESWSRPPIIRMTNVCLEPDPAGPRSLAELVADTDDGLLMTTNRSWSIDDLRLNFQFGCEAAWEIKGGKLGRILKKPLYSGITPQFWERCDAVAGPQAWRQWGFISCGKGDPLQLMAVGHGCAPARFRDVEVGSAGVSA